MKPLFICVMIAAAAAAGEPLGAADSLFNGRDLDGWINVNGAHETWSVRGGEIVCSGEPYGFLRTEKQYENYILELEWCHSVKGGNAGLFLHADALPSVGSPFPRSIEVQIMDGNGGDIFSIRGARLVPEKPHPSGWRRMLPSENRNRPAGQWNRYRVLCRNGTVTLTVNGAVVGRAFHCIPRKGYICLESEGSEIRFRNITLRELPGSEPDPAVVAEVDRGLRSIYNGVDLRGWVRVKGNEGHWIAYNGILRYDGKSEAEGEQQHLWTEEVYENFILCVDWRQPAEAELEPVPVVLPDGSTEVDEKGNELRVAVPDAGDSGIYLRGSSKNQVNIWNWPVGSGEIWGYRTDDEMPAKVRAAATPLISADNDINEWNRFEIRLIGDRLTVKLNGSTVISEATLPGIAPAGPLALQHHGDPIEFANIFIKKL